MPLCELVFYPGKRKSTAVNHVDFRFQPWAPVLFLLFPVTEENSLKTRVQICNCEDAVRKICTALL